jgi:hypothetical protein
MTDFNFFADQSLKPRHWSGEETQWLIKGTLAKAAITLIYAPSGIGKSYLAQSLVKFLAPHMKTAVYIDYENRVSALKKRGVDKIENLYYLHRTTLKTSRYQIVASMAALGDYEDALIVLDGAKHFVADIESDRQVREMMNALMDMRDRGATILIVHHTNKSGGNYQGSKELIDGCDNAFAASKCIAPLGFIGVALNTEKMRDAIENRAYLIETEGLGFTLMPEVFESADAAEQTLCLQVINALKRSAKPLNLAAIAESLGRDRRDNAIGAALAKFDGLLWETIKGKRGQSNAFGLIAKKEEAEQC